MLAEQEGLPESPRAWGLPRREAMLAGETWRCLSTEGAGP